jgi:proteasome lid subunit RPN8/RPN11
MKMLISILLFINTQVSLANEDELIKSAARTVIEMTTKVGEILSAPNLNGCPLGPRTFSGKQIEIESSQLLANRNGGRKVKVFNLKKPYPMFKTTDQAAKFFINYLRAEFKKHHIEYCTDIKKIGSQFSFTNIIEGTPGSCPRPANRDESQVVAGVHTHPGSHDPNHTHSLDNSINIPSVNDYAVASYEKKPQYMGAPSGHILKFTKDDTKCRGKAFLKRTYQMIQEPFDKTRGKLINQNSWTYIKSDQELNAMNLWICP